MSRFSDVDPTSSSPDNRQMPGGLRHRLLEDIEPSESRAARGNPDDDIEVIDLDSQRLEVKPHTWGTSVLITETAFSAMLEEVRPSSVETGGVMVGVPNPPAVLAAGCGGDKAVRTTAAFTGDPEADHICLEAARKRYGSKVAIIGYYHKHPPGMSWCSSQDLHQAQELVSALRDSRPLLVGIFTTSPLGHKLGFFLYQISRNERNFRRVGYTVIPEKDRRVGSALETGVVIPDENKQGTFWTDRDFNFYENSIGRARIRQELQELRESGWECSTFRKKGSKMLYISTSSIEIQLAPEYPLNPPRVFLKEGGEVVGLVTLSHWNSTRSLMEVLAEAWRKVARRPCCIQEGR